MGLGPIEACRQALARAGMTIDDIDLVEINEAFAAQVIPSAEQLGIDRGEAERPRRRDRARPPVRHDRRPHHDHADQRPADAGQAVRPRDDVRRRRPGHGDGRRAAELPTGFAARFVPQSSGSGMDRDAEWPEWSPQAPSCARRGTTRSPSRAAVPAGSGMPPRDPDLVDAEPRVGVHLREEAVGRPGPRRRVSVSWISPKSRPTSSQCRAARRSCGRPPRARGRRGCRRRRTRRRAAASSRRRRR